MEPPYTKLVPFIQRTPAQHYTLELLHRPYIMAGSSENHSEAVVITSSILATIPLSGVTTYCASKVFDSYLAEGLNMEYKKAIDIMSYQPGGVATKMI